MRPPAECGTDGGYYRHRRQLNEPACDPCKAAHSAYERFNRDNRGKRIRTPKPREGRLPCRVCGTEGTWSGRCRPCGQKARRKPRELTVVAPETPIVWVRDGLIWRAAA